MKTCPVTPETLLGLPTAIWMAGSGDVSVYHGSPVDMVRQMALEMGLSSTRDAVSVLLTALHLNRGLLITLPEETSEEIVSALFVYALLDVGVGHPMAQS